MAFNIKPTKSIFWCIEDSQCSIANMEEEKLGVEEDFVRRPVIDM